MVNIRNGGLRWSFMAGFTAMFPIAACSSGSSLAAVPDVVGKTRVEAERQLMTDGLGCGRGDE